MKTPEDSDRLLDLLVEWDAFRRMGQAKNAEELCPDDLVLQSALRERIAQRLTIERMIEPAASLLEDSCSRAFPGSDHAAIDDRASLSPESLPDRIGRYRVERLLGSGGFGLVYLAHDDKLKRHVAIKVPHAELIKRPENIDAYVREARSVANLEHPHIVPVYDVGAVEGFPCFVVSKYIAGTNLSSRMTKSRLSFTEAASIIATVAEALHYSHTNGLVHRDIKPVNILLSETGEPFVVDFGLSLREEDSADERRFAGTPAYMSPEQARGEAHRVDGRSDIFSLGVVFYELLVGRKPFLGNSNSEILAQITSAEPKPPRQTNDRIPKELERICLKSLAKRASDRYTTALDLAEDLRQFLAMPPTPTTDSTPRSIQSRTVASLDAPASREKQPSSASPVLQDVESADDRVAAQKIVPRGLRSFDEHDADFFLQLLPGPSDRDGLPDSIRFWKARIEERDSNKTFAVGLLYGPSGCGKTSLIKAGLLPRLSADMISIYLEATDAQTESQLLKGIRRRFPAIPDNLSLLATLAALRQHRGTIGGCKVLIVLDQFEQWLHSRHSGTNPPRSELVDALRQCDGEHLQALILVRDDFWMAVTRFAREIEVPLVEGLSINAVDLFPTRHAAKVLIEFGRAFGCISEESGEMSPAQASFVEQAISDLAEEGLVVPVRLVIFAEMLKESPWIPATLKQVGGMQGVGFTFLESTFSRTTSHVSRRYHEKAAQAVLKALLPESGTDIKGQLRTYSELLEVSGYRNRLADFEDLIRILVRELRLVTRTDPYGSTEDPTSNSEEISDRHCFQLTHDYLIPSLRDWLTQKQKETRRGRAELQLADRAGLWNSRPESRFLPSLMEFLSIRCFTSTNRWTDPQRKMMAKAARCYALRGGGILVAALLIGFGIQWYSSSRMDERLKNAFDGVLNSKSDLVLDALAKLRQFPKEFVAAECRLRTDNGKAFDGASEEALRMAYVRSELGDVDCEFLVSRIESILPGEIPNLLLELGRSREKSLDVLCRLVKDKTLEKNGRFQARMALIALFLGNAQLATELCQIEDRPYPFVRPGFIESFCDWHGDLVRLAELVGQSDDIALRSAICLGLAGAVDKVSDQAKAAWSPVLVRWWQTAPDAVTHSAAERVLASWQSELSLQDSMRRNDDSRDWYFNSIEMAMVTIPPKHAGTVAQLDLAGNPCPTFLISDREVSFRQFHLFQEDPDYDPTEKPDGDKRAPAQLAIGLTKYPINFVNWYAAIKFCNWLSVREGLSPCYCRTGNVTPRGLEEWRLIQSSNGYRLPSQSQWEFACRCGTRSPYSFGLAMYTSRYASLSDFIMPCAFKFPNQWGLFDMHGNVSEWCTDFRLRSVEGDQVSAVLGGNATMEPNSSRADAKWEYVSDLKFGRVGFRVARVVSSSEAPANQK